MKKFLATLAIAGMLVTNNPALANNDSTPPWKEEGVVTEGPTALWDEEGKITFYGFVVMVAVPIMIGILVPIMLD